MPSSPAFSVEDLSRRGAITAQDVVHLRKMLFTDAPITPDEARVLLALNCTCTSLDASWADFYIEAICAFLIDDVEPRGYLTAKNAEWLIGEISAGGIIPNRIDIELLVTLIDRARWSPESLARLALDQVREAVASGRSPLRGEVEDGQGRILESEIELVRRVAYAFAGDGRIPITRAEAEVLFAIDETLTAPVDPAWAELFVKAIVNVAMTASGYAAPTREVALRRDLRDGVVVEDEDGQFLAAFQAGRLVKDYRLMSNEERALERLERQRIEIITNEEVTQGEVGWLAARLLRDAPLRPTELAVLGLLARDGVALHPALETARARLAAAA